MAKITSKGLEEYELRLSRMSKEVDRIAGAAIYAGADIVADAIVQGIGSLPEKTGTTKRGLANGFGIAKMQDDNGYRNVKLGFDGYNDDGVPNVLMARVFENGTSKIPKHHFVRTAVNRSRKAAEAKMAEVLDYEIAKLME